MADGFTPALIAKILDAPKYHLRRKVYAVGVLGVLGSLSIVGFSGAAWGMGGGVIAARFYVPWMLGFAIFCGVFWGGASVAFVFEMLDMDDPGDLVNDFLRMGVSFVTSASLILILTLKHRPFDSTEALFNTTCLPTSDCSTRFALFVFGPPASILFSVILAAIQSYLCWKVFTNQMINPSRAALQVAEAKIKAQKKGPGAGAGEEKAYDGPAAGGGASSGNEGGGQLELGKKGRGKDGGRKEERKKKKGRTKRGGRGGRYEEV